MNFSTYALEGLKDFFKNVSWRLPTDTWVFHDIHRDLAASVKFLVPPPQSLNVKVTEQALKFVRLPYPICAFEYSVLDAQSQGLPNLDTAMSTRRIALAFDLQSDSEFVRRMKSNGYIRSDAAGIAVISIYEIDEMRRWMPSVGFAVFDVNRPDSTKNVQTYVILREGEEKRRERLLREGGPGLLLTNELTCFDFEVYPFIREAIDAVVAGGERSKQMYSLMVNDLTEELAMSIRVSLLLNTKNLKVVKVNDAPAKLNKKRERNKREPFFSYHTLDIFISDSPLRKSRKKVGFSAIQHHFEKFQNRLHSVTGHFKVRATGIFWWNHFVRGSKGLGQITKDYKVERDT